ncbi:MAG: hypothetical protein M1553_14525 [Firmicutes bacterium]|nr:hypothetical protein [Bacillota bacterium]
MRNWKLMAVVGALAIAGLIAAVPVAAVTAAPANPPAAPGVTPPWSGGGPGFGWGGMMRCGPGGMMGGHDGRNDVRGSQPHERDRQGPWNRPTQAL